MWTYKLCQRKMAVYFVLRDVASLCCVTLSLGVGEERDVAWKITLLMVKVLCYVLGTYMELTSPGHETSGPSVQVS